MTNEQKTVLRKIIYAVETGGQVYGKQDYSDFTEAYTNSISEYAITIGAGQWYGTEAQTLLKRIHAADRTRWEELDHLGLWEMVQTLDWSCFNISGTSQLANLIVNIISSTTGIEIQDALLNEQMEIYTKEADTLGVSDPAGQAMCANFRHQGGASAVQRILKKTEKPYSLENLYAACKTDTGNQVGVYKSRQKFVYDSLKKYFPVEVETLTKTEKSIQQMEAWAKNDSHGYDQDNRWGPDYDCSSAVISAWEKAGVPVKSKGATYTGNMKAVFLSCGFEDVTSKVDVTTGTGLVRGDVLLNTVHHTAMYCGNGREVEASINEKGTAHGGQSGDQTGKEFLIRSYRNYPWDCVLRYRENGAGSNTTVAETVAYVARINKDTQTYIDAGKTKSTLWPKLKKNTLVDVIKGATIKDSAGKKFYLVRLGHPTEGFVREYVAAGSFKKL